MENILSQDEVDALLGGISTGEVPTEDDVSEEMPDVGDYDLTKLDRIVKGRIPAMEVMTDRYVRALMGTFSSALRRVVDVMHASTEVKKFRDFLKSLPVPTSVHIFRMEPSPMMGLLVLESSLVYVLIDHFMGGTGDTRMKVEGRDFTNIENRLIRKLVMEALRDLEKSWQILQPVQIFFERSEINPQFAVVVPPSETVLCISLDVEMEAVAGTLILCVPYSMVEPLRDKLLGWGTDREKKDRLWMEQLLSHLVKTNINLSVELGTRPMAIEDILHLKVGDTFELDRSAGDPIPVKVEGIPKFLAYPGHSNNRRAVQVLRRVQKGRLGIG